MSEPAPNLDVIFAALADPVRRKAIELLGEGPRRSGELATQTGVSPATMSKHLRVLRESGLVSQSHPDFDTRVRIYALASAPMTELRAWLAHTEQGWTEQLAAYAEHLDAIEDVPDHGGGHSAGGTRDRPS